MRKKLISLMMAALMLLSLAAACGTEPAPAPTPDPAPSTDPTPAPTPTDPTPAPADPTPVDPDADKYGGDLVIAQTNISNTIDPHNSKASLGNYSWMVNVYDTVLSRDAAGNVFPQICDFTASEDGKLITLTMREYYYHNGTKIKIVGDDAKARGTDDKDRKVRTVDLRTLAKSNTVTLYAQWEKVEKTEAAPAEDANKKTDDETDGK